MTEVTGITVVIPTIAPRAHLLDRALASVDAQTLQPARVLVEPDVDHLGATLTRQRALEQVTTPWVAFLDDDDEFLPGHLQALLHTAEAVEADMVYSWYKVVGGTDPRPAEFGLPWDPENPRQTTITTLARTKLAQSVGGFASETPEDLASPDRHYAGEDWRFTERMNRAGKVFHLPIVSWLWHHHATNTSGLPTRW